MVEIEGPNGKWIDGEASTWKPELAVVRNTIDLAIKTGRFRTGSASNSQESK